MQQNVKGCTFLLSKEQICLHPTHERYEYCLEHLKYLTKFNVEFVIFEVLLQELGVDVNEVKRDALIVDDLGADSLDTVEIVMTLEEAFSLEFPDEDVEAIQRVSDAVAYVTGKLFAEPEARFIIRPNFNFAAIRQRVESNPRNITRMMKWIVQSSLFQNYIPRLNLKTTNVEQVLRRVLRNNWIDHVTTVPDFDDNKFSGAHILILSRTVLYHFYLQLQFISFTSFPLSELKLSYQIHYSENNEISEIVVSGGSRSARSSDDASFTFSSKEGIEGALNFLGKCLPNMESAK